MELRSSLVVTFLLAACSGASANGIDNGAGSDAGGDSAIDQTGDDSGSSHDGTTAHVPKLHRASAGACPAMRGAGTLPVCNFDAGPPPTCLADGDCTMGVNGRCVHPEFVPTACATACSYDECASDSDCAAGVPCECRTSSAESTANTCVAGSTCRVDQDCGAGNYCSPSEGFGSFGCGLAYFCHTAADSCVDDSDCNDSSKRCIYDDTTTKSWRCDSPHCAPPP